MHQTDVALTNANPLLGPQLIRATVRFVVSVGALIGVSLLLACL
jgi:hypothetical protein